MGERGEGGGKKEGQDQVWGEIEERGKGQENEWKYIAAGVWEMRGPSRKYQGPRRQSGTYLSG